MTKASATVAFYRKAVGKFLAFLGDDKEREVSEITRQHIVSFRNEQAKTLAPKTVNHDLKCLKSAFKVARRDGLLVEDPAEFVEVVRQVGEGNRRPFTVPELQAVLEVADDEWRSLVLFGLYTGQRLGDLARLTWAQVDLVKEEVRLATSKTDRRIILPLAAPLRRHLEALPAGDDPHAPLHPRAYEIVTRESRSGSLSNQFADLLAQAGQREKASHKAKAKDGAGRGGRRQSNALSFHCLRRTATTLLHEAGVPAAVVQELVGHDSEETHRVYINVGRDALASAAAKLPDLLPIQ
ncbi:MAG: tyrosine-type recombinase/integrase [Rhodospirillales bacterium]|nr:tyrosine-type recombinase/integrase [Acetobacter sp.]